MWHRYAHVCLIEASARRVGIPHAHTAQLHRFTTVTSPGCLTEPFRSMRIRSNNVGSKASIRRIPDRIHTVRFSSVSVERLKGPPSDKDPKHTADASQYKQPAVSLFRTLSESRDIREFTATTSHRTAKLSTATEIPEGQVRSDADRDGKEAIDDTLLRMHITSASNTSSARDEADAEALGRIDKTECVHQRQPAEERQLLRANNVSIEKLKKYIKYATKKDWRIILARIREVFFRDYNRIMCEYIHHLPVVDRREDVQYINGLAQHKVLGDVCRVCAKPKREVLDAALSSIFRMPNCKPANDFDSADLRKRTDKVKSTISPKNVDHNCVHDHVLDYLTAETLNRERHGDTQSNTPCEQTPQPKHHYTTAEHSLSSAYSVLGKGFGYRLLKNRQRNEPARPRKHTRKYRRISEAAKQKAASSLFDVSVPEPAADSTTDTADVSSDGIPRTANTDAFKFSNLTNGILQKAIDTICPTSSLWLVEDRATLSAEDEARRHACDELTDMGIRARMIYYKLSQTQTHATKLDLHGNYNLALGKALIRRTLRHVGGVPEADYYSEFMDDAEMGDVRARMTCACLSEHSRDTANKRLEQAKFRAPGKSQLRAHTSVLTGDAGAEEGVDDISCSTARGGWDHEYSEVIVIHGAARGYKGLADAAKQELDRLGIQTKALDEWPWLDKGMTIVPPLEVGKFFNHGGGGLKLHSRRVT